jgi:hypothetical protein
LCVCATNIKLNEQIIPLERLPLYAVDSYPNRYWTDVRNTTEWHLFISELVAAGNAISKLMLKSLPASLPDAHIGKQAHFQFLYSLLNAMNREGLFDSHALFTDILDQPQRFLNGTAPLNTTGAVHACVFQLNESTSGPAACTDALGSAADSFVWCVDLMTV